MNSAVPKGILWLERWEADLEDHGGHTGKKCQGWRRSESSGKRLSDCPYIVSVPALLWNVMTVGKSSGHAVHQHAYLCGRGIPQ